MKFSKKSETNHRLTCPYIMALHNDKAMEPVIIRFCPFLKGKVRKMKKSVKLHKNCKILKKFRNFEKKVKQTTSLPALT